MASKVGIWIDHAKAIIVSLDGETAKLTVVESGVPGRVRLSGGSRSRTPWGPQDVASESKREEKHKKGLREFYQKVIQSIRNARRIYVFGPGEAKGEFHKEISKSKELASRIAAVETADKMTDNQVIAKVKAFFAPGG